MFVGRYIFFGAGVDFCSVNKFNVGWPLLTNYSVVNLFNSKNKKLENKLSI